jgi:hypothetical protein
MVSSDNSLGLFRLPSSSVSSPLCSSSAKKGLLVFLLDSWGSTEGLLFFFLRPPNERDTETLGAGAGAGAAAVCRFLQASKRLRLRSSAVDMVKPTSCKYSIALQASTYDTIHGCFRVVETTPNVLTKEYTTYKYSSYKYSTVLLLAS